MYRPLFSLAVLCLLSCRPLSDIRELIEPDISPPVFLAARALSREGIELSFSEPAALDLASAQFQPVLEVLGVSEPAETLVLTVSPQSPGREYTLAATVADRKGNSLSFLACLYGFNPEVPGLLINEFTTLGSESHPDCVELKALAEGNLGGVAFYEGTSGSWSQRLVFPPLSVAPGDYILIHCKPQGIPEEVDEGENKTLSGGADASDTAYDFWLPQGKGLSGYNGVLSLCDRPGGNLLDGVLYSNRASGSDERFGGFGSADTLLRAQELVRDGGWRPEADQVRPEDGINPERSSATRSLCRDARSVDSDTREDWHIVPTRGFSFGRENSEEVY